MRLCNSLIATVALTMSTSLTFAVSNQNNSIEHRSAKVPEELYGGSIVDQTITVIGHDFFQQFSTVWHEKEMSERYVISIHELPSARHGNLIWVEYAQQRVFQTYLPASRANIPSFSQEAADMSYQRVIDAEVQRLLFREQDLGPDEI